MSRTVKMIGVALLAGLMTTVIAVVAKSPHVSPDQIVSPVGAPKASMRTAALDRCRTVSTPDTGCEAAWDAEQRRFFAGAER